MNGERERDEENAGGGGVTARESTCARTCGTRQRRRWQTALQPAAYAAVETQCGGQRRPAPVQGGTLPGGCATLPSRISTSPTSPSSSSAPRACPPPAKAPVAVAAPAACRRPAGLERYASRRASTTTLGVTACVCAVRATPLVCHCATRGGYGRAPLPPPRRCVARRRYTVPPMAAGPPPPVGPRPRPSRRPLRVPHPKHAASRVCPATAAAQGGGQPRRHRVSTPTPPPPASLPRARPPSPLAGMTCRDRWVL